MRNQGIGNLTGRQQFAIRFDFLGNQTMIDRDRAGMLELCRQFREAMAREVDEPFDDKTRARIGKMIGQAARQGQPDYVALRV
jgi:hypothetical protein